MIEDGLERKLDPGTPEVASGDLASLELPMTLGDAIASFHEDAYLMSSIPEELSSIYSELKRDEWARYCSIVTEWEFDQYWEMLP